MRIAQLIETLGAGGAESLAVDIAGSLAARGHDSRLLVLTPEGPNQGKLAESVRLHSLGLDRSGGWSGFGGLSLVQAFHRLESLVRKLDIQVLQTHLPLANFCGLGLIWKGCPVAVLPTVHNNREFDYGESTEGCGDPCVDKGTLSCCAVAGK